MRQDGRDHVRLYVYLPVVGHSYEYVSTARYSTMYPCVGFLSSEDEWRSNHMGHMGQAHCKKGPSRENLAPTWLDANPRPMSPCPHGEARAVRRLVRGHMHESRVLAGLNPPGLVLFFVVTSSSFLSVPALPTYGAAFREEGGPPDVGRNWEEPGDFSSFSQHSTVSTARLSEVSRRAALPLDRIRLGHTHTHTHTRPRV